MLRLFTRLASGLAPSVALGGEHGSGMWLPRVFALRLKSLHGKEWQERRDFFVARLQDGASCLPHRSAGTSAGGVTGRCCTAACAPPSPSPVPEIIPVWREKLQKDFAAVQGAHSSTLGALGQSCLHQPWGEQPRRSHSSLGQPLPSRTVQLHMLRMQLSSFPLLHSF